MYALRRIAQAESVTPVLTCVVQNREWLQCEFIEPFRFFSDCLILLWASSNLIRVQELAMPQEREDVEREHAKGVGHRHCRG